MAEERTAIVEAVVDHGADTRSLVLQIPGGIAFRPGQFLSCLIPVGGERLIRPYSIASDPEERERVELLFNLVPGGPGSHHLFGLAPGATIDFTGPWGTFVLDRAPEAETVFVAIDAGIAPVRPMVRRALATTLHPVTLLYAASHPIYRDELAALPRLRCDILDPAALEAEVTRRYLAADADRSRHFFVCGVGDPVRRLRDVLRGGGYARRAVQYERW
jgi:ferredoxin-NADP reductase